MRRGTVTMCTIPMGSQSFHKHNLISGQLPRRLILGFVTNGAFNGNARENPFNFQHIDLNYLSFNNGTQAFPSQPLTPNYHSGQYLQAFDGLCDALGFNEGDRGFGVNRENYTQGYTLYAFDLTVDQCEGNHVDAIKYGNIKLEAHFRPGLANPINLVVYAKYDSTL